MKPAYIPSKAECKKFAKHITRGKKARQLYLSESEANQIYATNPMFKYSEEYVYWLETKLVDAIDKK